VIEGPANTKLVVMAMKILHPGASTLQVKAEISCGFIPGVHELAATVILYFTWGES
jgi:hypothetical protein